MHDPKDVPVEVGPDRTLRVEIIDACGLACSFCHNEGTPVASDNTDRSADQFTGTPGRSGRVSIYLRTNGADFLPARIPADADFALALAAMCGSLPTSEVFPHLLDVLPRHPKMPLTCVELPCGCQVVGPHMSSCVRRTGRSASSAGSIPRTFSAATAARAGAAPTRTAAP